MCADIVQTTQRRGKAGATGLDHLGREHVAVVDLGEVTDRLQPERGLLAQRAGRASGNQGADLGELKQVERVRVHVVSRPGMLDQVPRSGMPTGHGFASGGFPLTDSAQASSVRNHTRSGQGDLVAVADSAAGRALIAASPGLGEAVAAAASSIGLSLRLQSAGLVP